MGITRVPDALVGTATSVVELADKLFDLAEKGRAAFTGDEARRLALELREGVAALKEQAIDLKQEILELQSEHQDLQKQNNEMKDRLAQREKYELVKVGGSYVRGSVAQDGGPFFCPNCWEETQQVLSEHPMSRISGMNLGLQCSRCKGVFS